MSGIAGIVGQGNIAEIERMASAMAYRGPYRRIWRPSAGVFFAEAGHDVSSGGGDALAMTAPVRDPAGVLVEPGALIDRLRKDPGACLRDLGGTFALAYFDDRGGGSVMLATDPLAYRTLYVAKLPGRYAFASDYKALLALDDCPAEINRDQLQAYIASMGGGEIHRSLLKGVTVLARGQMTRLTGDALVPECYLRLPSSRRSEPRRDSAAAVRAALETAVRAKLRDQSRVAVTLSAGLDATSLVALIRHVRPDIEISTYTIGSGPEDYEIIGARQSAEYFGTEHHELFFDNAELVELLPRYVWLSEDLAGSGEAILQQKVIETLGRQESVLFAGHGADILFAGMPRHRLLWLIDRSPPPLKGALRELLKYTQTRELPASWLGRALIQRAYGEPPRACAQVEHAAPARMPKEQLSLGSYMSATWNTMSAFFFIEPVEDAAHLTSATPFVANEVREQAQQVPLAYLMTARQGKKVLRDALGGLLPDVLRNRPKAIQRLQRDNSLIDALLGIADKFDVARKLHHRCLIPRSQIEAIMQSRGAHFTNTGLADLWTLVCAELWMQTFLDGRGRRPLGQ